MNHLQVEADFKNIGCIEEFISTSKNIPENKRTAALIIATEVFDNIAEHAVFAEKRELQLSVSNIFFPRLCFSYHSANFDNFVRALKDATPYFDLLTRRYRGFGLIMTKNLARKICYRQDHSCACIIVYL